MKISASKKDLLDGVNTVMKAVPARATAPIMECILIEADSQGIRLTANDSELGIETNIKGLILEEGTVALDAKFFSGIVRSLPDSTVNIATDANYITNITCDKAVFNIAGRSGIDFVALPEIEKTNHIVMSQFSLREIIRQTIFSVAANDNNQLMAGEYFEIKGDRLRVIALDGQRIAIRRIELKESYGDVSLIVPGKTLREIIKIVTGEMDDNIDLYFTDNHILFEFGTTKVVSRLIEGEYFRIDRMISSDYDTRITVDKRTFQSCIERASLLISESDRRPIIMDITDDGMELNIRSTIGTMNETIDIDKEGRDLKIGFNPQFVKDALSVIDDENITIYFTNSKAPIIIKDEEQSYVYLVLPITFSA
ncbi:MAG: DNA polymerase III subunit beta [Lachnospiraceae bacterium]|jgi:DNA polymerase-3 subunit beta